MKLKSLIYVIILTFIQVINTAQASSTITLRHGKISPVSELPIFLSKLVIGAEYIVSCEVSDPPNSTNPAILQITTTGPMTIGSIAINGEALNDTNQKALPSVNNHVTIQKVVVSNTTGSSRIILRNIDNDDTLEVVSCIAEAKG